MIIYAFVSRKDVVLVEHSKAHGNFVQISRMLLAQIDANVDTKQCYETGDHLFYYMVSNGLIYFCIADKQTSVTRAFGFLNEVRSQFLQKFGSRASTASAFSLNDEFERTLSVQMVHSASFMLFLCPKTTISIQNWYWPHFHVLAL